MSVFRLAASGLAVAMLAGCAALVAPPYSADYSALDKLKGASIEKTAVAPVQPRDASAAVNKISLRGASLQAAQGTFAQYLEDALIQDLKEVSAYDPKAGTLISATILKNDVDVSGFSKGTGTMTVRFTVTRAGATRLDKTYAAATEFESSFAGNVAIPKGQGEYGHLVQTLLGKVYADPEFVNALKN
jgi:hypothetical protein